VANFVGRHSVEKARLIADATFARLVTVFLHNLVIYFCISAFYLGLDEFKDKKIDLNHVPVGNTRGVGTCIRYQLLFNRGAPLAPKFSIIECSGQQIN
jgi:hypothetical protein